MKNLHLLFVLLMDCLGLYAQPTPKNIILYIGDGMGLSQISAGIYSNERSLHFERFKHIGLIKTHSSDNLITDSAAGATAYATGHKTYNGAISVNEEGESLKTIMEIAQENDLGTGVIATSIIQHATPACFYAHCVERTEYEEITLDFLRGTVDIAIGGGLRLFKKRKDKKDLVKALTEKGYPFYSSLDDAIESPAERMMVITHKGHLPSIKSGRGDYLEKATKLAIEQLDKSYGGFFLMVESSQIDWGGHSNDAQYIINEVLDFDRNLGAILDFAEEDGETLVIITADHETGGFSILGREDNGKLKTAFTTGDHSGTLVPIFAFGPGAENFTGVYDNTQVFYKMVEALHLIEKGEEIPNR